MGYDIFVSYSSQDKLFVDGLVNKLENSRIRCWYAPRDIPPGVTWPSAITQAIREIPIMLLVFSASANSSQEVSKELTLASNNKCIVIPVRIEDVMPSLELEYHLTNRHWLDVFDLDAEAAASEVLGVVQSYSELLGPEAREFAEANPPDATPAASAAANETPRQPRPQVSHGLTDNRARSPRAKGGVNFRLLGLGLAALIILAAAGVFWLVNKSDPYQGLDLRPAPDSAVYSYLGEEGLKVRTLRLNTPKSNQFLVQVSGMGNEYDGYIFLCTMTQEGDELWFETIINHREHYIFTVEMGEGVAFDPTSDKNYWASYVSSSTDWGAVQDFFDDYLAQAKTESQQ